MIAKLVNLDKYPINDPDSKNYRSLVNQCRQKLATKRLINVESFLTDAGTITLAQEVEDRMPTAFYNARKSNPYGVVDSEGLPADHPYRIYGDTERYGLARHDLLNSTLDALYTWPPLMRFVGDVLGLDDIFLHEDPSNALVAQIYKPGGGLAWHFDRALFSTILNISEPEDGGVFECVPDLRTSDDPCFDDVRDVLLDKSNYVERYRVKAGSFTIMYGRYTMHRVTRVVGERARVSVVLAYEDRPGVRLDVPTRRLYFGPTAPDDS